MTSLLLVLLSLIAPGDLYVATGPQLLTLQPGSGVFLSNDGRRKNLPDLGAAHSAQFDAHGHLFLGFLLEIREYDASLQLVRSMPLPEQSYNMVTDGVGGAYAVGVSGMTRYYGPDGVLQRQFQLPGVSYPATSLRIDLASDQCTLVYLQSDGLMAGGVSIQRFDACTMQLLAPLGDGQKFATIRLLRDGGFAAAQGNTLKFYDAAGSLILSRSIAPGPDARPIAYIAFDSDPAYVWTSSISGFLSKVRIADGATVVTSNLFDAMTIAVAGEQRPSAASLLGGGGRRRTVRH
jgi:hypothetical protein